MPPRLDRAPTNNDYLGEARLLGLVVTVDVLRRSPWSARGVAAHEAGHHIAGDVRRLFAQKAFVLGLPSLAFWSWTPWAGVVSIGLLGVLFVAWREKIHVEIEQRANRLASAGGARVSIARLNAWAGTPEQNYLEQIATLARQYVRLRASLRALVDSFVRR
jgi:hypothetical protein